MRLRATATDHWTTAWALVSAAARVVRRQRRLIAFPLLLLLAMPLSLLVLWLPPLLVEFLFADAPWRHGWSSLGVVGMLVWMGLTWYLGWVVVTFLAVALTSGCLQALREDQVSLRRAFSAALSRSSAILGFAFAASTFGAALAGIERRSRWIVAAVMAIFGLSWTLVSLFAVTAMAGERIGANASLRRGVDLLRARWADGRLTTLGLGLLWVPLWVIEAAALWWAAQGEGSSVRVVGVAAVLVNALVWAGTWLFERVYVAAVYCYAIEGVVPELFQDERLADLWQAAPVPPALPTPTALEPRIPVRTTTFLPRLMKRLGTLALLGYVGWQLHSAGWVDQLFPGRGVTVDVSTFARGPQRVATNIVETRGGLDGIAAVHTHDGPRIFLFGQDHLVQLDRNLALIRTSALPEVAASLTKIEAFEQRAGSGGVLIGINTSKINRNRQAVTAFDWDGNLLFQRATPEGAEPNAIAPIAIGSGWGVAVGYNGSYGLCLLDSQGEEKWCNRKLRNVSIVSSADCNGDGTDDILSLSADKPLDFVSSTLGCYDLTGNQLSSIVVPREAYLMRAIDLDGDGKKELAYFLHELNETGRFGAWTAEGKPLVDVHVDAPADKEIHEPLYDLTFKIGWSPDMVPIGMRRSRGGVRDVVLTGPHGEMLGVSPSGQRWQCGTFNETAVAIDLDDDGADELITLGQRAWTNSTAKHTVELWSWKPATSAEERRTKIITDKSPSYTTSIRAARVPIRPFGLPLGRMGPATHELAFRNGCYKAIGAVLARLPAIIDRDPIGNDLALCERALAALDVSNIETRTDLTWRGCLAGMTATVRKYNVTSLQTEYQAISHGCVATALAEQPARAQEERAAVKAQRMDQSLREVPMPSHLLKQTAEDAAAKPLGQVLLPPSLKNKPSNWFGGLYDVCVTAGGSPTSVRVTLSVGDKSVDAFWMDTIRAARFSPYLVFDTPIPICARLSMPHQRRTVTTQPAAAATPASK